MKTVFGQEQFGLCALGSQRRTYPDAWPGSTEANLCGEAGHVRKFCIGDNDVGTAATAGPSPVNHRKRPRAAFWSEADDEVGITQDAFGRVFAIGVVPVVGSVYRARREPGRRAHLAAQSSNRFLSLFAGPAPVGDNRGCMEIPRTEQNTATGVADVEPKRNALCVHLPETEGASAGLHTVAVGNSVAVGREVPGKRALRDYAAPGQVTVAALPCIAENQHVGGGPRTPSEVNAGQRDTGRRNSDIECFRSQFGAEFQIAI